MFCGDGVGHAGLLRHVLQFVLGGWVTAWTLVCPHILNKPLELGAGRLDLRRTRLLGGQEQRIADLPRIAAGRVVQERHWAVGDLELPDGDVVGELVAEIVLEIRAVIALRLGVDLDLRRGVVEAGDDAVAVLADRQRRLVRIGLRGACDLFGAADGDDQQGYRDHHHGPGNPHVNRPSLCARYSNPGQRTGRSLARGFCVSYALLQPWRQPLMGRSWRARCNRRRVLPPECQRRHQLGASGDRASPPHRSRGPRSSPRTPRAASRLPTRFTTASAFTGCRRGCFRRSPRCRWVCHGPGW